MSAKRAKRPKDNMTINIRFFALARDLAQSGASTIDAPDQSTVDTALIQIVAQFPALSRIEPRLATAVNQSYVSRDHVLTHGDELALIPPVSGG